MKNLTTNEIRQMWIDFFESKEHKFIEPKSLIPNNDPSLLWINSGVATLKKYFEGKETPPSKRLTNSQKSLRTNDLENVGQTARHHTMFEMLGNFSIGDYFKEDAIKYGWELMTSKDWFAIDPELLYITIFKEDTEAERIWLEEIGLDKSHLIKGNKKTNYWDIGKGPCGPNSEIWFDRGEKYDTEKVGIKLIEDDIENDRYIEAWNIVFSQYNNDGTGKYTELPRKNIDTGAGLERLASIFQETTNNFEIDIFAKVIKEIEKYTDVKYQFGLIEQPEENAYYKIIVDHIRSSIFTIADGAMPSNSGRGYVIRRLIRRAIINGINLELKNFSIVDIVPVIIETMNPFYSYLNEHQDRIISVLENEEKNYLELINSATKHITEHIKKNSSLTTKDAFYMFETYGYPQDIIESIANKNNIKINWDEFEVLFKKHQELAKAGGSKNKGMATQNEELFSADLNQEFVGYEFLEAEGTVTFLLDSKGEKTLTEITDKGIIIFDKTPFYATSGGQEHDKGIIKAKGVEAEIISVEKGHNKLFYHLVKVNKGSIKIGDKLDLIVDKENRFNTSVNHSATHLIFAALEKITNQTLPQAGSSNDSTRLRFDFTYSGTLPSDVVEQTEKIVNDWIKQGIKRTYTVTDIETAKDMGAAFMQDENYGDIVRVVDFKGVAMDLCGGTHVESTSDISIVKIAEIRQQGTGVYRVVAFSTQPQIDKYFEAEVAKWQKEMKPTLDKVAELELTGEKIDSLISKAKEIASGLNDDPTQANVDAYVDAKRKLPKLVNDIYKRKESVNANQIINKYSDNLEGQNEDGHYLVILDRTDVNTARQLAVALQSNPKLENKLLWIFNNISDSKTSFVITKTNKFDSDLDLGKLLREEGRKLGVNGGGNPDFVQGVSNVESLTNLYNLIKKA